MYLFYNSRIHIITLYSGHVCVYYASMLRYWHLIWILIRTDHPCLGVRCHNTSYFLRASHRVQKVRCSRSAVSDPVKIYTFFIRSTAYKKQRAPNWRSITQQKLIFFTCVALCTKSKELPIGGPLLSKNVCFLHV
jgi:hypothetical protein